MLFQCLFSCEGLEAKFTCHACHFVIFTLRHKFDLTYNKWTNIGENLYVVSGVKNMSFRAPKYVVSVENMSFWA